VQIPDSRAVGFMKKLTSQILIVLFAGSITVEATADPSAPYSQLLRAFISNADGPKWRADYAIALNGFCIHVVSKVPRNTPEEDSWVQQETLDAMNAPPKVFVERLDRVLNSKENARSVVRTMLAECVSLTNKISEGVNGAKRESALWAELAWRLSASEDLKSAAIILGLYSPPTYDPDGLSAFQTIHQTILQKALIPLLSK
jgi:hypothetical protein